MNYNFYLVDDDKSVLSILSKIIVNQNLGDIIGKAVDGEQAAIEIPKLSPDIVIVDLLLPKVDGITLVERLKTFFPEMPFIMISEVHSKEMVSKAYNSGVEFFVNKPINVIEVMNVIKRVDEKLRMKKVIDSFQSAFQSMRTLDEITTGSKASKLDPILENAKEILNQLGILSEAGCKDIINILEFVIQNDEMSHKKLIEFKLTDLYAYLSTKYEKERGEIVNEKAIEQRIRRAIGQALENVSELALDDYEHLAFMRYASTLFEFREVRKEMDYIKRISKIRGKINIKKFIIGLVSEAQSN